LPYKDVVSKRAYQARWIAKRREDWLLGHGPCIDCGSWEKLEVDHVDATTKITHRVWSWTAARRNMELEKCVVRCHPCHDTKTLLAREQKTPRGERNGSSKLTEDKVREIRALREEGTTYTAIAQTYRVCPRTVRDICLFETWKHVR